MTDFESMVDGLIRIQAIFLGKTEAAVRKSKAILADLQETIEAELAQRFAAGMAPKTRAQVQAGIDAIQAAQSESILEYGRVAVKTGRTFAGRVAREIADAFAGAPAGIPSLAARRMLSATQVAELAREDILGDTAGAWFQTSALQANTKAARILRASYAEGSSFETIFERMRNFSQIRNREQESLARTVIQGISNNASKELYSRNRDVIDGLQWAATLDDRTCLECGPLDGKLYRYKGAPSADQMPSLPLHPNCRCTTIPYIDGLSGEVPTWEDWLGRQSPETQAEVLGPTRAGLYRAGTITASDLRGRAGQTRPVADLVKIAEKRKAAA